MQSYRVPDPNLVGFPPTSCRIPPTGVGESVLPQVKEFLDAMELPESAWMKDAHAIYKLGNKFEGWVERDDSNVMTFWWNFDERLIKASRPSRK